MNTDIGEYIVGAYLQYIKGCDYIIYNARPPGGKLEGLGELDVIGLDFKTQTAYLCEVTTWIQSQSLDVERLEKKFERQKNYAKKNLKAFPKKVYMFWSPYVPIGKTTDVLKRIPELKLVINKQYTDCFDELRDYAKKESFQTSNPAFRMLQIEEHLRRDR